MFWNARARTLTASSWNSWKWSNGCVAVVWRGDLEVDAELAQIENRRFAPARRARGEWQCHGHPVCLAQWLPVAIHVVVTRRRLNRKADRLKPTDELPNVLTHRLLIVADSIRGKALRSRSPTALAGSRSGHRRRSRARLPTGSVHLACRSRWCRCGCTRPPRHLWARALPPREGRRWCRQGWRKRFSRRRSPTAS